jgi:NTE family protein
VITRNIGNDIAGLRGAGTKVTFLTPGPEDLAVMGANLMNPRRRTAVLHTAMRTSATMLRQQKRQSGYTVPTSDTA